MAKQENKAGEETLQPAQSVEDVALQPPTLASLQEQIDDLDARLESLESMEPVRGDAENAVDRVAKRLAREIRRARYAAKEGA